MANMVYLCALMQNSLGRRNIYMPQLQFNLSISTALIILLDHKTGKPSRHLAGHNMLPLCYWNHTKRKLKGHETSMQ